MPMFKDYYTKQKSLKDEEIEKLYLSLTESEEDEGDEDGESTEEIVLLKREGLEQLFQMPFVIAPDVDPTTEFILLDPKTETGKDEIKKHKESKVLVVAYSPKNATVKKPAMNVDHFKVPSSFWDPFVLNDKIKSVLTPEQNSLIKTVTNRGTNGSKDPTRNITDEEMRKIISASNEAYKALPVKERKGLPGFKTWYLLQKDTDTLFEIKYDANNKVTVEERMFNDKGAYRGPEIDKAFKVSGRSQQNEDCQAMGFFFDAPKLMAEIAKFQQKHKTLVILHDEPSFADVIAPFVTALDASKEYKPFSKVLKRDYKKFGFDDWCKVLGLAGGATVFQKEVSKFETPYIIHKSISEYRSLEEKKMGYGKESKHNTADIVLSNVDSTKLLQLIANPKTILESGDNGTVSVKLDGSEAAKYYQISLKETPGSKLGQNQKYFAKTYSFIVHAHEVFEGEIEFENMISESLITRLTDAAKNGAEVLKKIGKETFEKIKKISASLMKWKDEVIDKITKIYLANVGHLSKELFHGAHLTEDVKTDVNNAAKMAMVHWMDSYNVANSKIQKELSKLANSKYSSLYKVLFKEANTSSIGTINEEVFKAQIFNYAFIHSIHEMIYMSGESKMEDYVENLVGFYVEALFGSTQLPLWKLYGLGYSKVYEYLGTKKENANKRKSNILENSAKEGLHLLVLDATSVKKGTHNFYMYILSNVINEDGTFAPRYGKFFIKYDKINIAPVFAAIAEVGIDDIPKG